MIIKILATWIMFIPIAIVNGIVRDTIYKSRVGELVSHQISTVVASLAFFILTYLIFRNDINRLNIFSIVLIGLFWLITTIVFELLFGLFIEHVSIEKLLSDYNISQGRVWPIFLITEFASLMVLKLIL